MTCGSGGSKSRLAKTGGAEPSGQKRDENLHAMVVRSTFRSQNVQNTPPFEVEMSKQCTPLWHEARFQVRMRKTPHVWNAFGSWDIEKVLAVAARSTFPSQNVQNTSCSERFWKWRCRKSARRCGAKHMSKSKVQKTDRYGAFGRSHIVSCGRRKGLCTSSKVNKTWRFCSSFNYNHHYTTLHCTTPTTKTATATTLHYTPLHSTPLHEPQLQLKLQLQLHYTNYCRLRHTIPLHYTTLNYTTPTTTTLHYTTTTTATTPTLRYTTLLTLHYANYITLITALHWTALHYTNYNYNYSDNYNYTTLHYATLRYTTLHYTTLHHTTPHHMTPL